MSTEEGRSYAQKYGKYLYVLFVCWIIGLRFTETSALDSSNVEDAFMSVIREIYDNTTRGETDANNADNG